MTESRDTISEDAVHWVVRMNCDQRTHADEADFRTWLEKDPAHARSYADCAALWDGVGEFAQTDEAHERLRPLREPPRLRRFNRRVALFGGFGAAAAAAAVALIAPDLLDGEQTFQTTPGQQKRLRLADGTGVLLNTDSRLRVTFGYGERRIFLDRGQAFFQVAKDKTRPFRVFVGADEVRALGTAFEVRRIGDSVQVTLEEGRVAIYRAHATEPQTLNRGPPPRMGPEPAVVLSPGQQAVLASAEPVAVRGVDLRKVQAWRYGRMILDDAPLGEAIADLNRYGGVQIVLADPKLGKIRVSGVFHTGRPDDFVEAVTAAFPVEIARQNENTIVLAPH
jgi:transmembrane sensor